MEEIKEVLHRHSVAGYVVLQSPHYAEFLISFPLWGCIALGEDGKVRVYAKREQFESREAQKACVEASAGMILQLETILPQHAAQFRELGRLLGQHFDISHMSQRYDPPG